MDFKETDGLKCALHKNEVHLDLLDGLVVLFIVSIEDAQ
jgi:hypothetical protein